MRALEWNLGSSIKASVVKQLLSDSKMRISMLWRNSLWELLKSFSP